MVPWRSCLSFELKSSSTQRVGTTDVCQLPNFYTNSFVHSDTNVVCETLQHADPARSLTSAKVPPFGLFSTIHPDIQLSSNLQGSLETPDLSYCAESSCMKPRQLVTSCTFLHMLASPEGIIFEFSGIILRSSSTFHKTTVCKYQATSFAVACKFTLGL